MSRLAIKNQGRTTLIGDYVSLMGGAVLRHRAEVAERAKRVEGERANKVISQFVANMSHELRTPLNAIIGFSEFMKDIDKYEISKENIEEYSGFIYNSSARLLKSINNIIDISKIHSGAMLLDCQNISVSELLQTSIRLTTGASGDGQVTISENIPPDVPDIFVDILKLKQVFTNILKNAVEMTPAGGTITVSAESAAGGFVKITFSSAHHSMSGDRAATAEASSLPAKSERDWEFADLGIGLAIADALVGLHKGRMNISSRNGAGNEVAIILPACSGAADIVRRGPVGEGRSVAEND